MSKVKFTNIGTMNVNKKKDPNNPDEPKKFHIRLQQNKGKDGKAYGEQVFPITLANGKVLNDGDSLIMFAKKEKFQELVQSGKMTQQKADELSAFLLFDICVVEDVNEGSGKDDSSDVPF